MDTTLTDYLERRGIRLLEEDLMVILTESIDRVIGSVRRVGQPGLPPDEKKRLEEGGFSFEPSAWGPEHPVTRGAAEFAALLGTSLTVAEAAQCLGVNPTRIRQRLTGPKRTLYGIKRDREWWLPRFQFSDGRLVPGIAEVIKALDEGLHPVSVWRWFTMPHMDLREEGVENPLSPLDWLSAGHEPAAVVSLATHL